MRNHQETDGQDEAHRLAALRELRDEMVGLLGQNLGLSVGLETARTVLSLAGQDPDLSLRELALFTELSPSTLCRVLQSAARKLRSRAPYLRSDIGEDPSHNLQAPTADHDPQARKYGRHAE